MTVTSEIVDPLPRRFLTDDRGVGGAIKVRPEDFVVDEQPLYEPCGSGEHVYLRVQKTGVSHAELISCIRRHFGVRQVAIGYAGMKDKQAVTSQTVSIHTPDDPPDFDIDHERITVHWATRHTNKLRRGHLVGNRFAIRIRDVDPLRAPAVLRILRRLETSGVPAYYGSQRFGYRRNNHRLGALLVRGSWAEALDELLGTGGTPFPEYQRPRRERYDAGAYAETAAEWSPADRSELMAVRALVRGASPEQTIARIGPGVRSFWLSALESAAFNHVLDARLDDGALTRLVDGDLAWKHDSRSVFAVTPAELAGPVLAERLARLEISPSGPMWGAEMTEPRGAVAETERAALLANGVTPEQLRAARYHPEGGRRPLRTPITNADVEGGLDEHGPYIRVAFDLPRGMYATVVMREIMKEEEGSEGGGGAMWFRPPSR